ncbi:MAG TPA: cupin domain-containing protein [Dongiaceae bacterium]|jgi:mannose-6-phosphate isomerase-like protein (cupin superfamily)|nr:cupin domain-containing protein [Dongiaceae bacterium]
MSLYWKLDDVYVNDLKDNNIHDADRKDRSKGHDMRLVYGQDSALAISLRHSGYHSSPHIHDYEQINFIQEGEMWFFVHDKGYHVKKGDFLRIPRNAIHWSWVKTKEPCLCYEVFCPPPPQKKRKGQDAHGQGLFDDGEEVTIPKSIGVYFVDMKYHGLDLEEIESKPACNRPDGK